MSTPNTPNKIPKAKPQDLMKLKSLREYLISKNPKKEFVKGKWKVVFRGNGGVPSLIFIDSLGLNNDKILNVCDDPCGGFGFTLLWDRVIGIYNDEDDPEYFI